MRSHFAAVDGRPATCLPSVAALADPLRSGSQGPTGAELAGLGLFLAAAFLVPFVAGLALDALLRTSPLLLFIGLLVGIAAAATGLYGRLKRYL